MNANQARRNIELFKIKEKKKAEFDALPDEKKKEHYFSIGKNNYSKHLENAFSSISLLSSVGQNSCHVYVYNDDHSAPIGEYSYTESYLKGIEFVLNEALRKEGYSVESEVVESNIICHGWILKILVKW